ncbi:MAG: protein translocase subunit SecF [Desulfovibrio sp.]|nr:protein translocase subunit SecF [Desulfovibrio sp.]
MGFQFIKPDTNIDFIGKRRWAYGLSLLILLAGIISALWGNGLKLGIDFAGGVMAQLQFAKPVEDEALKKSVDIPELPGVSTQRFGEDGRDYLLRFSSGETQDVGVLRTNILEALNKAFPDNPVEIQRLEVVGPKIGADLTNKALSALYYAVLLIAVYISGRFEQRWMAAAIMAAGLWGGMYLLDFTGMGMGWQVLFALGITLVICFVLRLNFALGAVIGLLHDVFITVGILSILDVEIDLNVMAAILTIIGYSLNDTIIVYDRLRENLRAHPKGDLADLINKSVNQTLSRTILTSGTTFIATFALYALGGGVIHDFALTMMLGVVVGTFSSIYVSSAILLALGDTDFYVHLQEKEEYEKPGEHGIV